MTNVLILMSDEHNANVMSPAGHTIVDTPNMKRLAARGTTYDAAYCPSPLCAPCRASFLSGLPPHQTQVYNNCRFDDLPYPSYGGVLREQGIHTATAGKSDAYTTTDQLGFSETMLGGDRAKPGDTNFHRSPLSIRADGPSRASKHGPKEDAFHKDLAIVDAALDWLTTTAPGINSPWTLTVNIVAPHFPHIATEELWEKYANTGDLPDFGPEEPTANHPYAKDLRDHFQTGTFAEDDIRKLRQGYYARVEFVDQQLGRLLDALDTANLTEDTVIAYTSDHGEMLGNFGMWWKCSLYEDAARVPLIVAGPGFEAGTHVATPVTLLDLQATIFRAVDAARPPHWWGGPLQDVNLNDPTRVIVTEYHGHGTRGGTFLVRRGSWKLLVHESAPDQLFDLEHDPHELTDLREDRPEIVASLRAELDARVDVEDEFNRAQTHEHHLMDRLAALA